MGIIVRGIRKAEEVVKELGEDYKIVEHPHKRLFWVGHCGVPESVAIYEMDGGQ